MANSRSPSDPNSPQPTTQESSVLFSLRQLMELEHSRIQEEQERALQAQHARAAAKLEAELRLARDEEGRRRAVAQARVAEEALRREEQARLDAIREAELLKARMVAAEELRLREAEAEHTRRRELLELDATQEKRRLKRALIAVGVVTTVALVGGAFAYVGVIAPEQARERSELERANDEARARAEEMRRSLATSQSSADQLNEALLAEKNKRKRAEREAKEAARASSKVAEPVPPVGGRRGIPTVKAVEEPPCDPKDPMCFSLKR